MSRHVGLLRNVNVGGTGRLPMRELVPLCEGLGATGVRTYIQSGNLVFDWPGDVAPFAEALERAIVDGYGFTTAVITRTAEEWSAVLAASPFPDDGTLHVAFLRALPDPERVAALDPDRSPGDHFAVRGREVYLHLAKGAGTTKLTNAWFDRQLQTASTWRNTRTVKALEAML